MEYQIRKDPSYAMVEVTLADGEQIETKPGVMMDRTGGIGNESDIGGDAGIAGTVGRMVSDERSLIDNTYYAQADDERVTLVPEHPGDIVALDMGERDELRVQSGSLLAWEPLVERSTEWNNRSNLFSSGELTVLGLSGRGMTFLSSFGSMVKREVTPENSLVVDEDHLVAWTAGMDLSREKDGSLKSTVLGGEGLVTRFNGEGEVWLQTRNPMLFYGAQAHEDDDSSGGIGVDDFL
ncbi:TIGR00266 family protein [Halovenus sp. HT40]|uniref:TIGR00266 family protein n=1 Tax=Halovenus sp. HT40 TaxID=3126691 RepID=UPI00300EDAB1